MKKVNLLFGTVNSQPAGTADEDLEDIYQKAYKPFLSNVYNFPNIAVSLYYSGTLLTWLEQNHSEFTDVINEMVARRQVELLGGGFHDPVLPLIPRPDRLGQIESLTTYLRKRFGKRPRGSWITEQLWEPFLASTLKNSGMEYTLLDDYHFVLAGLAGHDLHRPVLTEDQGKTLGVIPLCHYLQSRFLELEPVEFVQELRNATVPDEGGVIGLMIDGDRIGARPGSYERAFTGLWLKRFFEVLGENADWLQPVLPSRYLRAEPPRRRAYFSATSFWQMNSWDGVGIPEDHVQGGFFRQLLTHYAESNLMYAKMQYEHILVNQIRGDKYRKQTAREELWKGQCHAAYWRGRHDGIYKNNLRKNVYTSLIESEKITREKGIFIPSIIGVDFDMDGLGEYLFQGHEMNAYVHREGGKLIELDYLPTSWNYLDTLGPATGDNPESTEAGYLRRAAIDHFYLTDEDLQSFAAGVAHEAGDFLNRLYDVESVHRENHDIQLSASGTVQTAFGPRSVRIRKSYTFKRSEFVIKYQIENTDEMPLETVFATEYNFALLSNHDDHMGLKIKPHGARKETVQSRTVEKHDLDAAEVVDKINGVSLSLGFSTPASLWITELCTSHGDPPEPVYQGTCFVARWGFELGPRGVFELGVSLMIDRA